jgi:hypothetical protein
MLFTREELERLSDLLEADEQEILDTDLEFTYVYDQPDGGRRPATEADRSQWLSVSQSTRGKIFELLEKVNCRGWMVLEDVNGEFVAYNLQEKREMRRSRTMEIVLEEVRANGFGER